MPSPLIVALDLKGRAALELAKSLDPNKCNLKVGSQLFTSEGPEVVKDLKNLGFKIFLDLKFHDIPNTITKAIEESIGMGVWMVNIHATGGSEMMQAASKVINKTENKPLLLGVTLLTSLDKFYLKEVGLNNRIEDQVILLAKLCKNNGLDGVVCATNEIQVLRRELGEDFIIVTPGIRSNKIPNEDQKRVSTPRKAIDLGANYIVMGREVALSKDPSKKVREILEDIS